MPNQSPDQRAAAAGHLITSATLFMVQSRSAVVAFDQASDVLVEHGPRKRVGMRSMGDTAQDAGQVSVVEDGSNSRPKAAPVITTDLF
jgi:hypothetical protein